MIVFELFFIEFLGIDGAPTVDDVGEHERNEQRDVEHRGERELTAAGVRERQRRLEIGGGRIVSRIVPGTAEQQGEYSE